MTNKNLELILYPEFKIQTNISTSIHNNLPVLKKPPIFLDTVMVDSPQPQDSSCWTSQNVSTYSFLDFSVISAVNLREKGIKLISFQGDGISSFERNYNLGGYQYCCSEEGLAIYAGFLEKKSSPSYIICSELCQKF